MDMLFRSNSNIDPMSNDMFLNHRHYGKTIIGITRRPQDIPPKFFESCHYIFIFTLDGKNAKDRLNAVYDNMGDMAAKLPYKSYYFIMKKIGEAPVLMKPIDTESLYIAQPKQ